MTREETEIFAARVVVSGRVQGVCFRASTQSEAERLGLVGWVRNRDDGSVELHAEGGKELIERLIQWCRKGPPSARVTDIHIEWPPLEGNHSSFAILHR
jgi:acylphosphatase